MAIRSLLDVPAPAKLNLFLHVVGRRADGYHLLESVFTLIDWCDTLHFERRTDGRLTRHDLGLTLPPDDLSIVAARLLQRESGTSLGADITLDKRVPWGAGLGGGSSDAATTLLALNRLWRLNWPRPRLLALGLQLGADVPFFVGGNNAHVEGVGERLTPVALPPQRFAVVKPPQTIATAALFQSFRAEPIPRADIVAGLPRNRRAVAERGEEGFGGNDLQGPAQAQCAQVTEALEWLAGRFGNSRMTGSGSAVFARVSEIQDGTGRLAEAMHPADLPPGWTGRMCHSLTEHPLRTWAG